MTDQVQRALRCVPAVYFYLPAVTRQMGKDLGLVMTDDLSAVLWLTASATTTAATVPQGHVRKATGLTPGRFSTVLSLLLKTDCITQTSAADRRHHQLAVTDRGHAVLAAIKEERADFLRDLFKTLSPKQQAACTTALATLETTMWQCIQR